MVETNAGQHPNHQNSIDEYAHKIDLACNALRDPNIVIDGYGNGISAARRLLAEALALQPDNSALAQEINKLDALINSTNNSASIVADPGQNHDNAAPELSTSANNSAFHDRLMSGWAKKPLVEIIVCVRAEQLKSLADTIDSIAAQSYSNWKLTVISNAPSPDDVFSQHDILQWIQTDSFNNAVNSVIANSTSEWIGLVPAGGALDTNALFNIADLDNQNADQLHIIYANDETIISNGDSNQSAKNRVFSLPALAEGNLVGDFCFVRNELLKKLGNVDMANTHINNSLVMQATQYVPTSAISHISDILLSKPSVEENKANNQQNVA